MKSLTYNPKIPLKHYRDYRKNCEWHTRLIKIIFFIDVPFFLFVLSPGLIYGVMTVIDYLKRFI